MIIIAILKDIQNITKYQPTAVDRFNCVRHYLLAHHKYSLYDQMTAPGIVPYEKAWDWFYTYYVEDQQDGPEMAQIIRAELLTEAKDPKAYYWGNPNGSLNFETTPGHMIAVDDYALDLAINELYKKLQNRYYKMYDPDSII